MADLMINSLIPGITEAVTGSLNMRTESTKDAEPEFASMLSGINSLAQDRQIKSVEALTDTKTSASAEQNLTPESYKDKVVKEAKQEKLEDNISDDAGETLQKYNDKIKKAVMEKFDISEEELDAAMEILGLEYIQLLIPDNLIQLSVQITGAESPMELLANDAFSQLFQELPEMAKELMEDLNITPDMFQAAMADNSFAEMITNEQLSNTENPDETIMESQEYVDSTNVQLNNEATNGLANQLEEKINQGIENGTVEVTIETESKVMKPEQTDETVVSETEDIAPEVAVEKEVQTQEESNNGFGSSKDSEKNNSTNNLNSKERTDNVQAQNQSVTGTYNEITAEMVPEQVETYTSVDTMDIINQVNEFMRMNINGQDVSLEMQLNPANLGKIGLNVSLKEGMITAQLAVENETVKHALESQMVILRENMDAQGLKVDAVEVTIASHEFEQNLEGGQSGQNADSQENKSQQSVRHNIRLEDMIFDQLTEEEQLTARIMAENGNSMDITA